MSIGNLPASSYIKCCTLPLTCSTKLWRLGGAASLPGVGRCTTRRSVPIRLCQKGMWLKAARAVTVPTSMLSVCVAVGRRRATSSEPSPDSADCERMQTVRCDAQQSRVLRRVNAWCLHHHQPGTCKISSEWRQNCRKHDRLLEVAVVAEHWDHESDGLCQAVAEPDRGTLA